MVHSTDITFSIITLGCSKNQVDAEKVRGGLISAGFTPSDETESADIIIVNTCGFITPAKEESIEVILDALEVRNSQGEGSFRQRVVVTGCLSKRYFSNISDDIPEIDFLYGLLDEEFIGKMADSFGIALDGPSELVQSPIVEGVPYGYIKISEGCSNNCSYCAIPLIRGGHDSFSPEKILADARQAVRQGARELVIIAQDTAAYCYGEIRLPGLIEMISEIPGVEWVRILYCHPDHVTPEIINLMAQNSRVLPYIDLPFQHISGKILKSMGRGGSYDIYRELIHELRRKIPRIRIRSTFMTGYPGETDKDFKELLAFLKEMKLDRVGAFPYSPEEDTTAALLDNQVPPGKAKKRYQKLMAVQQKISAEKLKEMIGAELQVLVEEQIDEKTWVGRSEFDAPEVDGVFYLTGDGIQVNSIVTARVTDAVEYDLIGEVT